MKIIIDLTDGVYKIGVENPIQGVDVVGVLARAQAMLIHTETMPAEPTIKAASAGDVLKLARK